MFGIGAARWRNASQGGSSVSELQRRVDRLAGARGSFLDPRPDRRRGAIYHEGVDVAVRADRVRGVIELFGNRAAAERALRGVLRDEPTWASFVRIAEFPLIELPAVQRSLN